MDQESGVRWNTYVSPPDTISEPRRGDSMADAVHSGRDFRGDRFGRSHWGIQTEETYGNPRGGKNESKVFWENPSRHRRTGKVLLCQWLFYPCVFFSRPLGFLLKNVFLEIPKNLL